MMFSDTDMGITLPVSLTNLAFQGLQQLGGKPCARNSQEDDDMAKVFRTSATRVDKATGKRVPVTDSKGSPVLNSTWRARIEDHRGIRRNYTLSTDKKQAQQQADMIENREREMRQGLRPLPTVQDKAGERDITEIADEYLEWGGAQGGRKGLPWSPTHSRDKRSMLLWQLNELGFTRLCEVQGCLPHVEKLLRNVAKTGRPGKSSERRQGKELTGKTLQTFACALKSFFAWCVTRRYLDANPLEDMGKFNTAPRTIRRNMSGDEIDKLLMAAPLSHQVLLEVGLCTGLRRGELRSLTVHHFDPVNKTLRVDANVDKARVERQQRIPDRLVDRLTDFIASGEAKRMYRRHYNRKSHTSVVPEEPLLFVPEHASRTLKRIAQKAGVELVTAKGKIDFHALRLAYINLLIGLKTDFKTILELSRHTAAYMTALYARTQDENIDEAVESVGRLVLPPERDSDVEFGFALRLVQ